MRPLLPDAPRVARWPASTLIALVRGYRLLLSAWLGNACRFEPTCSAYAIQALERHGAMGGSYLAAHRIARCHPWCAGGAEPVPLTLPSWFRRPSADAERVSTLRPLPPSPDQPNRLNLP